VTFGVGFSLGLAPFLFSISEPLTYLIPLSLRDELRFTTALLGGLIALTARRGEPLGRSARKVLQIWSFGALAGLALLVIFQSRFIVRLAVQDGLTASEVVVAPPRLNNCPCPGTMSNTDCLHELTLRPADMDLCWEKSQRLQNRLAWTFGYLLLIGGAQSFLALLWVNSGRTRAATAQPAAGAVRQLFLSYSRLDRNLAERLADDLKAHGFTVWWDCWEMEVGDSLPRKIEEAISRSTWFGIILSPDAITSAWVRAELDLALTMEIEGGLTILPILHRPCEPPLSLRGKVWADFTSSYQEGLEALRCVLKAQSSP
jgi:hypothetical protein